MNFNSLAFLIFLPVVVLLYWLLPHKFRWVLLLAASYFFYMSWNAWLIVLIMTTTVTAYVTSILISRTQKTALRRLWLAVALVICLGLLIFFKYTGQVLFFNGIIQFFIGYHRFHGDLIETQICHMQYVLREIQIIAGNHRLHIAKQSGIPGMIHGGLPVADNITTGQTGILAVGQPGTMHRLGHHHRKFQKANGSANIKTDGRGFAQRQIIQQIHRAGQNRIRLFGNG